MCDVACPALWSWGIRGCIVILVYCTGTRGSLDIATPCIACSCRATIGSHTGISGCRDALVIMVRYIILEVYFFLEWLRWVIFVEGRQANLGLRLTSLAICLCLYSVEAHLFIGVVSTFIDGRADFSSPCVARTASNATSANAIEATAEEEKNPGSESQPNCVSNRCGTALHGIHARFCYEKDGNVKDKGYESDGGSKSGYATAEAAHGHLTNMSKKAKNGSDSSEAKSDDVENEDISEPFDDDLGYLQGRVTDEGVYILVGG